MEFAIAWFVLLGVAFYFFLLRPQRRQIAEHQALIATLEVGDEIITAGGVYGTVRALRDDVIELEIADGVIARVARAAVARHVEVDASGIDGPLDDETA
jgi:preprotein translocase subunit YajC